MHTGAQLVLPLQGALGNLSSGSKVIIQGDYLNRTKMKRIKTKKSIYHLISNFNCFSLCKHQICVLWIIILFLKFRNFSIFINI